MAAGSSVDARREKTQGGTRSRTPGGFGSGSTVHAHAVKESAKVDGLEQISATERAVHGAVTSSELRAFLDAWIHRRLGSMIADVRFRAGRIDAVWGVALQDGREVVIKAHRAPVDLDAVRSTRSGSAVAPN